MSQRIAAVASLVAFAVCLLVGALQAQNSFGTTVSRALAAMIVTLVVGLVVGAMAQRMIQESVRPRAGPLPDPTEKRANEFDLGDR